MSMPSLMLDPLIVQGLNNPSRKAKFLAAIKAIETVVNDPETKEWFLKQDFKQKGELSHLSNEELFQKCMRVVQFNYSVINRSWWKRWSSVIGYTLDNFKTKGPDIFTYKDSYDGFSVSGLSGHLLHEISHLLGFSHTYEWTKDRDYSIPYAFGNYVESRVYELRKNKS